MYIESIKFLSISWKRSSLTPLARKKYHVFGEKKHSIFPDNTRKIMSRRGPFWKDHLFNTFEEISYFRAFFWEWSSSIFCLRGKIIFSGKRDIIFPNNKRKTIFQRDFFGKTIFSGRLEKENMVFRVVKSTGTGTNLSTSNLSTLLFKLIKRAGTFFNLSLFNVSTLVFKLAKSTFLMYQHLLHFLNLFLLHN